MRRTRRTASLATALALLLAIPLGCVSGQVAPPPPRDVRGSYVEATGAAVLAWATPAGVPEGAVSAYRVYRDQELVATLGATSYADDLRHRESGTYLYQVSAIVGGVEGIRSLPVPVEKPIHLPPTTPPPTPTPPPPTLTPPATPSAPPTPSPTRPPLPEPIHLPATTLPPRPTPPERPEPTLPAATPPPGATLAPLPTHLPPQPLPIPAAPAAPLLPPALADLSVVDLRAELVESGVTIVAEATNLGLAPAGPFDVLLDVDLAGIGLVYQVRLASQTLPAGATANLTATWHQPPAALATLRAALDPGGLVPEGDETNNFAAKAWVLPALADPGNGTFEHRPLDALRQLEFSDPTVWNLTDESGVEPILESLNSTVHQDLGGTLDLTPVPLVSLAWVRDHVGPEFHSLEPFELVEGTGDSYLRFLDVPGDASLLSPGGIGLPGAYTLGHPGKVWLTERAMRITVEETPAQSRGSWNGADPANSTAGEGSAGFLVVDFDGADHSGQAVRFNASWLDDHGIWAPEFTHEFGNALEATLDGRDYVVDVPHFSSISVGTDPYAAGGFVKNLDQERLAVLEARGLHCWEASPGATGLEQMRRSLDEPVYMDQAWSANTVVALDPDDLGADAFSGVTYHPMAFTGPGADVYTGGNLPGASFAVGTWNGEVRLQMRYRSPSGAIEGADYVVSEARTYALVVENDPQERTISLSVYRGADWSPEAGETGTALAGFTHHDPGAMRVANWWVGLDAGSAALSREYEACQFGDEFRWEPASPAPGGVGGSPPRPQATPSPQPPAGGPGVRARPTTLFDYQAIGPNDSVVELGVTDPDTPVAQMAFEVIDERDAHFLPVGRPLSGGPGVKRWTGTDQVEVGFDASMSGRGGSMRWRVDDGGGASEWAELQVSYQVPEQPPSGSFTLRRLPGSGYLVEATARVHDANADHPTGAIDWGDGASDLVTSGSVVRHRYACPPTGTTTYLVGLNVGDDKSMFPPFYSERQAVFLHNAHSDADLLDDCTEETASHTDAARADTDGDGLLDHEEHLGFTAHLRGANRTHRTSPLLADSDGDGFSDREEALDHGTDPMQPDFDHDGAPDGLDEDPFQDLWVTVSLVEYQAINDLDFGSDGADMQAKISVNTLTFKSAAINDVDRGYPSAWSGIFDASDAFGFEQIRFDLFDVDYGNWNPNDRLDISRRSGMTSCEIQYSPRTGSWQGDDQHFGSPDLNGVGHCSGTEDGNDDVTSPKDAEIWFKVEQMGGRCAAATSTGPCQVGRFVESNVDGDRLPYYWERSMKLLEEWRGLNSTRWDPYGPSDGDYDNDTLTNLAEWSLGTRPEAPDAHGFNVSVGLNWTDVTAKDFADLREGIRRTGDYLWEATDGRFYFANVTFREPGLPPVAKKGDIRIYVYNKTAKWDSDPWPVNEWTPDHEGQYWWPSSSGLFHIDDDSPRHFISMPMRSPQVWPEDVSETHRPREPQWSKTLLHEIGHFAFGLHEEYEGWSEDGEEVREECPASIMYNEHFADHFSHDDLTGLSQPPGQHNENEPCWWTKHWQLYWESYHTTNSSSLPPGLQDHAQLIADYPYKDATATPSNWRVIFDRYKGQVDFDLDGNAGYIAPNDLGNQTYINSKASWDPYSHPSAWSSTQCEVGRCPDE